MSADHDAARGPGRGGDEPELTTCSKCGMTAMAFICDEPGCPVNGGAAYPWSSAPAAPAPGAEAVAVPKLSDGRSLAGWAAANAKTIRAVMQDEPEMDLIGIRRGDDLEATAFATAEDVLVALDTLALARHGAAAGPGLAGAVGDGWIDVLDEAAPADGSKFDAHCVHPETGGFGGRIPDVQMRGDRSGFGIMIPERGGAVWAYLDGRDGIIAPWRMTHWRRQPAPPRARQDGDGDA